MGKNIRRGRTASVRCASCGQITRRDRAVYLFKDGMKAYYCPDCAKKIHGQRLYKGMPKYVKRTASSKVKRKFTIFATEDVDSSEKDDVAVNEEEPAQINLVDESADTEKQEEVNEENKEDKDNQ